MLISDFKYAGYLIFNRLIEISTETYKNSIFSLMFNWFEFLQISCRDIFWIIFQEIYKIFLYFTVSAIFFSFLFHYLFQLFSFFPVFVPFSFFLLFFLLTFSPIFSYSRDLGEVKGEGFSPFPCVRHWVGLQFLRCWMPAEFIFALF